MIDPHIPPHLQDLISRELERDERVVWSAMPKPRYFAGPVSDANVLGLLWTAFWAAVAAGSMFAQFSLGFDFSPHFGVPFFLIGIGMLSTPLWAYRTQLKTVFLITNRRVITIEGGRSSTIRTYLPENLKDIFRREYKDGTGDVIFTRTAWKDSDRGKRMQELGFLGIQNAKSVETMLKTLAEPWR